MTLIEKLIEAGYPRKEMYHHYSDLCIFVTPLTTKVVDEWFKEQKLNKELFASRFKDNVTGKQMYCIAFQYYEGGNKDGVSEENS